MKYINYLTLILLVALFTTTIKSAQNIFKDSLLQLNYKELSRGLVENLSDTLTANIYAEAYLKKALLEKDTLKSASGYYNKIIIDKKSNGHLIDTIIQLTKNLKNENYPTIAYHDKAVYYVEKRNFKKATDYFLMAIEHNTGSNNDNITFLLNNAMAYLKSRMGENEEALILYKASWEYAIENKIKELSPDHYLSLVFALAHIYRKNNLLENAKEYNDLGFKEAELFGDNRMIYMFTLNDGLINFHKKNYRTALDTIENILPEIIKADDKPNIAVGYHYLGKLQLLFENPKAAVLSFKEVDTVFQKTHDLLPELRGSYEHLIDYYKKENDLSSQLTYVEQLMKLDSILTQNYKYVNKNINQKYDSKKLVLEKEHIIKQLKNEKNRVKIITAGITSGLVLSLFFGFYQFRKRSIYKKRFNDLLENNKTGHTFTVKDQVNQPKIHKIEVPEEIVGKIINALSDFEEKKGFLNCGLTLNKLATKIKTNSNYLSKVINYYKNENFSSYIKKLRVSYAMQRIKSDQIFRKYTIKAIAEESGFKSAEAFSTAFYKTYGIYPSYFIKELDKLK